MCLVKTSQLIRSAMIEPQEALEIILNSTSRLDAVDIDIVSSVGYILDEEVKSIDAIPPFDNSAMDGFAIRAADTNNATAARPARLKIIDDQPAGKVSDKKVRPGTAIKVMTGAPIPVGADSVIPVELTVYNENTVSISEPFAADKNIRLVGEDIPKNSVVMRPGRRLGAVDVGVLASIGRTKVKVVRKPRVSILGTGDELIPLGAPLAPGKIRDSNSFVLLNQVLNAGAEADRVGVAKDTQEDVRAKLSAALANDVIVTTGGVSVGERDFVKDVLLEMGAEQKFWKVAQKPGKPVAFLTLGDKLIFALPGNPVAAVVCFEEYARPALLKMMGRSKLHRPLVAAVAAEDFKKKSGRRHHVGVKLEQKEGRYFVKLNGRQGSGILTSMAGADGIALLPKEATLIKAGEKISVQLINLPEDH